MSICHAIDPSGTVTVVTVTVVDSVVSPVVVVVVVVDSGSTTSMKPSVSVTLSVMFAPLVSLMNAPDHSTGYTPEAQSSGTVYESTITTSSSDAATPTPSAVAKPNSLSVLLYSIVAL